MAFVPQIIPRPRISAKTPEEKEAFFTAVAKKVDELLNLGPADFAEGYPYQPSAVDGDNLGRVLKLLHDSYSPIDFPSYRPYDGNSNRRGKAHEND